MARECVRGACAVLSGLGNSLNEHYPSLAKFSSHSPYSEVFRGHCFMLALIGLLAYFLDYAFFKNLLCKTSSLLKKVRILQLTRP